MIGWAATGRGAARRAVRRCAGALGPAVGGWTGSRLRDALRLLLRLPALLVLGCIRAYQRVVSPLLGPRCRYVPSCSSYAVEALRSYGLVTGVVLTGWRLLRCQPWGRGGFDPLPELRWRRAARGAGAHGTHQLSCAAASRPGRSDTRPSGRQVSEPVSQPLPQPVRPGTSARGAAPC